MLSFTAFCSDLRNKAKKEKTPVGRHQVLWGTAGVWLTNQQRNDVSFLVGLRTGHSSLWYWQGVFTREVWTLRPPSTLAQQETLVRVLSRRYAHVVLRERGFVMFRHQPGCGPMLGQTWSPNTSLTSQVYRSTKVQYPLVLIHSYFNPSQISGPPGMLNRMLFLSQ